MRDSNLNYIRTSLNSQYISYFTINSYRNRMIFNILLIDTSIAFYLQREIKSI